MENEKTNLRKFENCKNIKLEDVGKFVQQNGYEWSGYINDSVDTQFDIDEYQTDTKFYFYRNPEKSFDKFNHFLIWNNSLFIDDIAVNCNNNKFVRYIYFSISTFKVYTVLEDKKYPKYLTIKLEKDLSKEWVQFLAKRKENYKPSLIQLMIRKRKQAEEDLVNSKEYVKNEKAKLDKHLEEKIVSTNEEITTANTTTSWLEELN